MIGRSIGLGEVMAFVSGKGGTGKTSVCAGIAAALAEEGKKVLCIDCDVGLRNLDISLGMSECGALSFLDICEGNYPLEMAAQHPDYPTLYFLTAPLNRRSDKIGTESFAAMLRKAKWIYDYILLDAPAGVDAGFQLVAESADRLFLVTGSGPAAVRDAARVGDILELMGKTDVRLIVNRVDRDMLSAVRQTIDDVMDQAGLPLCGIVPEDPNVVLAATFGHAVVRYAKRCPASKAYRRITRRIQGYHSPILRK